eukprot:CAMPEP_0197648032 /NCGR_PEP_ID=MMETSP1338-20131121/27296_1 /TAXON_ID=43686 ORGANISM="Pelagodinium beii, Strain RCC1491" /NCGR_SAMPLE_ID=MMETSP1338 /ASSEMBLY_ACC=CAM_ASM_000754 /LENGTH=97 /DNA_ID=CAMNT_0043221961 /DNA_START=66 /DNA_END=359 /DNA_ORIENTATION=+
MAGRHPILPGFLVLGLLGMLSMQSTFLSPPRASQELQTETGASMAAGAAAGMLTAEPAFADMYKDEIFPIAFATSGAILWGIVLGFVLLRLQEAFPE